jgi:hypothetical protein
MLIIKSQGHNTQSDLFACIATNAPTMDVILAVVQADPTTVLHDPEPHHTIFQLGGATDAREIRMPLHEGPLVD